MMQGTTFQEIAHRSSTTTRNQEEYKVEEIRNHKK